MHLILLGLGVVAILAGAAMIGFGIPINEFGLGNTLIAAGTTALVGGFVVVGLAATVGQLTRIAGLLGSGAPVRRAAAPPVPADAAEAGQVEPVPVAAMPPPPAAGLERTEPWPVPTPPVEAAGQSAPPRPAARTKTAEVDSSGGTSSVKGTAAARPLRTPPRRGEIPVVLSPRERMEGTRPAEPSVKSPEPIESAPAGSTSPDAAPAVTILKSGVIDGMAYTLYSDGSIEAELPEGTMRFPSIDDLRLHLAGPG